MSKAWIHIDVLHTLEQEAQRALPNETGGMLIGYRADNGELVVQELVGPGPKATHLPHRFLPDHEWQCQRLDTIYRQTKGRSVYLGDWHTHPCGLPNMSWLDRRTLRAIARHPTTGTANPVMLIGGNAHVAWQWKLHGFQSERMFGLRVTASEIDLKVFEGASERQ
jgi:integrative and conjugative element protein (TIGR02256 family)